MAIIRCPYCHAIIDETAKYCNNCGTQLLFPDDETLDEEIPGEMILDTDVEDKDYEIGEPDDETINPEEGGEEASTDESEEVEFEKEVSLKEQKEEEEDEAEEPAGTGPIEAVEEEKTGTGQIEGAVSEEVELKEAEIEEQEEIRADQTVPEPIEERGDVPLPAAAELDTAEVEYITDSLEAEEPPAIEAPVKKPPAEDETATVEIAAKSEVTFDTRDLDNLGGTVDLGKEKIDRFLEVMAEKEKEAVEEEETRSRPRPPEKADTGGTLPPWADVMVGAPSFDTREKTDSAPPGWEGKDFAEAETPPETGMAEEEAKEEKPERILPRRRASDSGIGFPERLTQPVLPFGEEAEEKGAGEEEQAAVRERALPRRGPRAADEFLRPGLAEQEEAGPRPPFNLTDFVKAKAFDCLFLALLWLVGTWFAARALDTGLFRLFSSAGGLLLTLYFTLLVMYFFLFQFFLGETLGDRVFRKKG